MGFGAVLLFDTPRGLVMGDCVFGGINAVAKPGIQTVPRAELGGAIEAARLYVQTLTAGILPTEVRPNLVFDATYTVKGWSNATRRTTANWDLWRALGAEKATLPSGCAWPEPLKANSHLSEKLLGKAPRKAAELSFAQRLERWGQDSRLTVANAVADVLADEGA